MFPSLGCLNKDSQIDQLQTRDYWSGGRENKKPTFSKPHPVREHLWILWLKRNAPLWWFPACYWKRIVFWYPVSSACVFLCYKALALSLLCSVKNVKLNMRLNQLLLSFDIRSISLWHHRSCTHWDTNKGDDAAVYSCLYVCMSGSLAPVQEKTKTK